MINYCVSCGVEIYESMGTTLARDIIDFLNGKRKDMRQICGICNLGLNYDIGADCSLTERTDEEKGKILERILRE